MSIHSARPSLQTSLVIVSVPIKIEIDIRHRPLSCIGKLQVASNCKKLSEFRIELMSFGSRFGEINTPVLASIACRSLLVGCAAKAWALAGKIAPSYVILVKAVLHI